MKCTPETLKAILDQLGSAPPNYSKAARVAGIGESTFWSWCSISRRHEQERQLQSPFLLVWPEDSETDPEFFHRLALERCRELYKARLDASIRSEVLPISAGGGVESFVFNPITGAPVFERDPKFEHMTDQEMADFGFPPDARFLKDGNGKPRQMIRRDPAAAHLKIHATKSLLPEYSDKRTVTLDAHITHAAHVIGRGHPVAALLPAPDETALPADGGVVIESETEIGRALRHLDSLPPSPMIADMRRTLLKLATDGPQRPMPNAPVLVGRDKADDPVEGQGGQGIQRPPSYRSPEARAEGIGSGWSSEQRAARFGGGVSVTNPQPEYRGPRMLK